MLHQTSDILAYSYSMLINIYNNTIIIYNPAKISNESQAFTYLSRNVNTYLIYS